MNLEDKLVELTMQAWRDNNFDNIIQLADVCGYEPEQRGDTLYMHGLIGIALPKDADPLTIFVMLGYAFAGDTWAHVCPNGLEKVNKIWKESIKTKKLEKK